MLFIGYTGLVLLLLTCSIDLDLKHRSFWFCHEDSGTASATVISKFFPAQLLFFLLGAPGSFIYSTTLSTLLKITIALIGQVAIFGTLSRFVVKQQYPSKKILLLYSFAVLVIYITILISYFVKN